MSEEILCETLWCKLTSTVQSEVLIGIFVALALGIIGIFLKPVASHLLRRLRERLRFKKALQEKIARLEHRLDRGLGAVRRQAHGDHLSEGSGLWMMEPKVHPSDYELFFLRPSSIPIYVFANLKGGVGKTTNATSLAAHWAMNPVPPDNQKPALLLDFDYQGSASSMCVSDDVHVPKKGFDSMATKIVTGEMTVSDLIQHAPYAQKDGMMPNIRLRIVPAYYDLAVAENRLMIEWLFGEEPVDIRYRLAKVLHDPRIQQHFSRIIIDAPPRLTTACVQALCAATHVIIPTVLDQLSGEAVRTFIGQIQDLKLANVCPHIKYAGVVGYRPGNPTAKAQYFLRQVADAEDSIRDALSGNGLSEDLYLGDAVLVHQPLLAECAGKTVAYAMTPDGTQASQLSAVRSMFSNLASAIERNA